MNDVCGYCGATEANPDNALCNNCGSDYWVQSQDFNKADWQLYSLKDYIEQAAENLGVSVEELQDIVEGNNNKRMQVTS